MAALAFNVAKVLAARGSMYSVEGPGSVQQHAEGRGFWQRAAACSGQGGCRPSHELQTNEIPQCFSSLPQGGRMVRTIAFVITSHG